MKGCDEIGCEWRKVAESACVARSGDSEIGLVVVVHKATAT